jgi:hypothetical protein
MCFNKKLSLTSFLFGIISSILLIYFGNTEYSNVNSAIGYFYIFISLVQLFEFFMWYDIECKSGFNSITTKIMPLMVYSQPLVYGGILNYFLSEESNNIISKDILLITNIAYAIYLIYRYKQDKIKNTCTTINEEKHLSWDFTSFEIRTLYNIMMILNSINFWHHGNIQIHMIWVYLMLFLSNLSTKENLAELWCFSATSTPLVVWLLQK